MRRSTQVTAPLLAAAAFSLLTACRKPDMQRCVDENNNVVADNLCQNQPNQPQQRPDGHGGFIPFFPYRYYYGGWGGYGIGTHADGGAFTPTAGRSYSTTSRGGFGRFFSGGGGEGSAGHAGSAGA